MKREGNISAVGHDRLFGFDLAIEQHLCAFCKGGVFFAKAGKFRFLFLKLAGKSGGFSRGGGDALSSLLGFFEGRQPGGGFFPGGREFFDPLGEQCGLLLRLPTGFCGALQFLIQLGYTKLPFFFSFSGLRFGHASCFLRLSGLRGGLSTGCFRRRRPRLELCRARFQLLEALGLSRFPSGEFFVLLVGNPAKSKPNDGEDQQ